MSIVDKACGRWNHPSRNSPGYAHDVKNGKYNSSSSVLLHQLCMADDTSEYEIAKLLRSILKESFQGRS